LAQRGVAWFFRTSAGAEIDLLLELRGHRQPWPIEIKRGLAPKTEKGFHLARESVRAEPRLVVYGGDERFPLADGVEAVSLGDLFRELAAA
jgi:predicted AAA+ superfamily ATPase